MEEVEEADMEVKGVGVDEEMVVEKKMEAVLEGSKWWIDSPYRLVLTTSFPPPSTFQRQWLDSLAVCL